MTQDKNLKKKYIKPFHNHLLQRNECRSKHFNGDDANDDINEK